ncbi:hypothetical protein MMC15_006465 [Xylographa vitiligo]|nr:hypothetical protein [Xylographa vitiligo]
MATETITAPALLTGLRGFSNIPPFPNDVSCAPLLKLSFKKLQNGDGEESDRLFEASKQLGFFYLDLRDSLEGDSILEDVDHLFRIGEQLFDLDVEEKQKYDFSGEKSYFGYKGYGKAIIDKEGTLDRNEFYNVSPAVSLQSLQNQKLTLRPPQVSKDDILALSPPLPAPAILAHNRPRFSSYIRSAHSILSLLLARLNQHLHLPPNTLPSLHRLTAPSGDQVRLLKAPRQDPSTAQPALGAHTDFGSLTLLFNRVGGLQVLPPTSSPGQQPEWLFVRPLPGCAIVNLGDALSKFTGGLLRSNIHRVVPAPGEQARLPKFSVVYFSRPEDEVLLKRLGGGDVIPPLGPGELEEAIPSKEWVIRRAMGRRVGGNVEEGWSGTESLGRGK